MAVLLAIQDTEVHTALRLLLEEQDFTVLPARGAQFALRVLARCPEPLVAVLDAHLTLDPALNPGESALGESAAECVLQLATSGEALGLASRSRAHHRSAQAVNPTVGNARGDGACAGDRDAARP